MFVKYLAQASDTGLSFSQAANSPNSKGKQKEKSPRSKSKLYYHRGA